MRYDLHLERTGGLVVLCRTGLVDRKRSFLHVPLTIDVAASEQCQYDFIQDLVST